MRSIWKRLLFTSVITIAITVLLSVLPHHFKSQSVTNGDVAVFHSVSVKRLSSDNLVDSLLGLQLALKPKRVVWKEAVLSVDLLVEELDSNTQLWMGDLERLLYLAFIKAENVNRVLVRFVELVPSGENGKETTRFLAATDIRRTDSWLTTDLSKMGTADPFTDIIWKQRLRLSIAGNSSKASSL